MSDAETTQTRLPVITAQMLADQSAAIDAKIVTIHASIGKLIAQRDALLAVLTEIVDEFHQTYDATSDGNTWKGAAQINARVMERAERLVSK